LNQTVLKRPTRMNYGIRPWITQDNNLYIKVTQDSILLIEVYVDDIIFGSNDDRLIQQFAKDM
jgi:hypothetical protein